MAKLYAVVKIEEDKQYLVRNLDDKNVLLVFESEKDAELYRVLHCRGGVFVIKEVTLKLAKKELDSGQEL